MPLIRLTKPVLFLLALLLLALGTHRKIFSDRGHSVISPSRSAMKTKDTVPATVDNPLLSGACGAYSELRSVNFLHKSISESICEGVAAYTIVDSAFPLCRLKQHLPLVLTEGVRAASVQTFIRSPLTQRNVSSFVYSSPDFISTSIRKEHIFEERNVRNMQRIIQKLAAKSPVTFVDVGSNIGVFTLSMLDLGVPVIALDANIRNLIRIKLSAEAVEPPHKLHLLWNFVSRQVSLMYLNFPKDCNIGGATKFGRAVVDTIPVMSSTADSIVPLIDTKLVVLKVDIEGGEGEFFKSAKKLFESFTIPVVHMEWLKKHMSEEERQFMISFFAGRRYSPRTMKDLTKLINISHTGYQGDDLIWVHKNFEGGI
ncbi:hypothetical protein BOX15_Mlig026243g2 [Macrostomum lignano]|uniref:Methyltransferase FkbM domain-containing protein n=1 Tax=Macrostomum lignano TaxID=282301 RepID=A0A267DMT2_9PLAT|nr:hypothetical protein BOX15_Mlig026243g1 [Macrostomum lignano]PAA92528.1 hypothetical protein BOX15_Mlig026243g2 [Macrostomum lignano]